MVSWSPPADGVTSSAISGDFIFQNSGASDGGETVTWELYVSADAAFDAGDTLVGSGTTGALAARTVTGDGRTVGGEIRVLGVWSANDGGRIINPTGAEGQIEGQVLQGLGFAKTEEMIYREGHLLNPDFMTSGPGSM